MSKSGNILISKQTVYQSFTAATYTKLAVPPAYVLEAFQIQITFTNLVRTCVHTYLHTYINRYTLWLCNK